MDAPNTPKAALQRASNALGGQAALASAIGFTDRRSVWPWFNTDRRVPAEHCPEIEAATRRAAAEKDDAALVVTCEELRPDVNWGVLRLQAAAEQSAPTQRPGPDRRQPSDHCMQASTSGRDVAAAVAGVDAKPQEA